MTLILIFLGLYLSGGVASVALLLKVAKKEKLFKHSSSAQIIRAVINVFFLWPWAFALVVIDVIGNFLKENVT